ncbi:MAG: MFS transporter [Candidatus Marinimicrobia bacterium]|nr:MFS transporter [Candidatus Neomarinimicrobiota bacterium]
MTDSTHKQTKLWQDPNLLIVFSVTLIAIQGVASLTPAIPKIAQQLQITPRDIGLLITFFTLPGVFLTPVLGILADRYGRKRILAPSLIMFGLGGFACFFARDFQLLLAFRFLQGVGAAAIGSLNITLIGDLYSGRNRAAAMGYNASVLSTGTATYPVIGGALATLGWYMPFLLPLLALPVAFLVLFHLKNPEPKSTEKLGQYLKNTWRHIMNRQVLGLFGVSLGTFILLYGVYLTFFPLLMDEQFHAPPFVIGLVMSTSSISTAITSFQLGYLSKWFTQRTLMKIAFGFYGLTTVLVPFIHNIWLLLIPTVIFGVAQGLNMPSILTLLTGLAPMDQRAAILSLNGTVLRLGQTLGPFIMGLVYALWQLNGVFVVGTILAILLFVLVAFTLSPPKSGTE